MYYKKIIVFYCLKKITRIHDTRIFILYFLNLLRSLLLTNSQNVLFLYFVIIKWYFSSIFAYFELCSDIKKSGQISWLEYRVIMYIIMVYICFYTISSFLFFLKSVILYYNFEERFNLNTIYRHYIF